jgi:hypothetical protein
MSSKLKSGLLFLVVLLVFQEIILRIVFPIPELSNFDRANYIPGTEKGMKFPFYRNSKWVWESELDTNHQFVHQLNQYGFRDDEWKTEKPTDKKRILIIGDSFTEGIMAEQDQTVKSGFIQKDKDGAYKVLNLGIMGVGMNSYLRLATDAISIFKPDVVCLLLYSNDISNKKPIIPNDQLVAEKYNYFTPRLLEIYRQIQGDSPIPFRFDWKKKSFLPSIKEKNFPWFGREELMVKHTTNEVRNAMVEGKVNPFKLNQILREKAGLLNQPQLEEAFNYLKKLEQEQDVQFLIAYIPARHQVTNYYYQFDKAFCKKDCPEQLDLTVLAYNQHQKYLENLCKNNQLDFINFTSTIQTEESKNQHMYWNYDDHMKGKGYLLLGNHLYDKVERISH